MGAPEPPPEQDDNIDTTNEANIMQEEDEEPSIVIRRRRRRPMRQPPNMSHLGSLEENVQAEAEEEEVEVEQGETVLLFPRLVLERIRLTPSTRPSSRRQSEDSSNRAQSPVQGSSTTIPQQAPD